MANPTPQVVSLPAHGNENRKALLELIDSTRDKIEAGLITEIAIASIGKSTYGSPAMHTAYHIETADSALSSAVRWLQKRMASAAEDE